MKTRAIRLANKFLGSPILHFRTLFRDPALLVLTQPVPREDQQDRGFLLNPRVLPQDVWSVIARSTALPVWLHERSPGELHISLGN